MDVGGCCCTVGVVGMTAQPKHTRKEWDLNDPANRQLPRPTRDGDNDPRLGASSIQVFAGEDLRCAERRRLQMVQQAAWNQQMVPTTHHRLRTFLRRPRAARE
jgi:hypothetical protein